MSALPLAFSTCRTWGSSTCDRAAGLSKMRQAHLNRLRQSICSPSLPAVSATRYLTNEQGGIRDDLMIAYLGDRFTVVANAACKDADERYLHAALQDLCMVERLDDQRLARSAGAGGRSGSRRICSRSIRHAIHGRACG